ncbi:MAG TPA: hypothetical protein EYN69_05395 [Flavobacteriales bacterium]|nr:hypothetical protein [Flavobacteriales bacterium]
MRRILFYVLLMLFATSCSYFKPSIMLRTDKNFEFATPPTVPQYQYKIAPNDYIQFRIFSNDGFKLIDLSNFTTAVSGSGVIRLQYLVEFDGTIKLPTIGRIPIAGKTLREAELMLEDIYSKYYNKPFVMLKVDNRRVIIFPGSGGDASVINLTNDNTTLLEALALAGGISTGKARRIKLIRGDRTNPQVFLIDLSTIEGMKEANMVIQANDIIYVEPVIKVVTTILDELDPIISLLTSVLFIVSILQLTK